MAICKSIDSHRFHRPLITHERWSEIPTCLDQFIFAWSDSWCENIADSDWNMFPVLGICFRQK